MGRPLPPPPPLVSALVRFYDFCSIFNNYFITSAKRLDSNIINEHINYSGFYIRSILM